MFLLSFTLTHGLGGGDGGGAAAAAPAGGAQTPGRGAEDHEPEDSQTQPFHRGILLVYIYRHTAYTDKFILILFWIRIQELVDPEPYSQYRIRIRTCKYSIG